MEHWCEILGCLIFTTKKAINFLGKKQLIFWAIEIVLKNDLVLFKYMCLHICFQCLQSVIR